MAAHPVCGMFVEEILNILRFLVEFFLKYILPTISLILLFYTEWLRRPRLEFLFYKDEPTPEDLKRGYMWYHLKIKNKELRLFNRDAALNCIMRVDFWTMIQRNH
jgi:hypothetical protein